MFLDEILVLCEISRRAVLGEEEEEDVILGTMGLTKRSLKSKTVKRGSANPRCSVAVQVHASSRFPPHTARYKTIFGADLSGFTLSYP